MAALFSIGAFEDHSTGTAFDEAVLLLQKRQREHQRVFDEITGRPFGSPFFIA
jgi:hypothetical protein